MQVVAVPRKLQWHSIYQDVCIVRQKEGLSSVYLTQKRVERKCLRLYVPAVVLHKHLLGLVCGEIDALYITSVAVCLPVYSILNYAALVSTSMSIPTIDRNTSTSTCTVPVPVWAYKCRYILRVVLLVVGYLYSTCTCTGIMLVYTSLQYYHQIQ